MKDFLHELGLAIESPIVGPDAINYRPPSWPPHPNWPVIIDAAGETVSCWGDSVWRLDPWAGKKITLNFGDSSSQKFAAAIDSKNADLLRIITGWWMFGPSAARGYRGLKTRFDQIRKLFVLCSQEGILATELAHFPRVIDRLPSVLQVSRAGELLGLLHELYERRDALGFVLLDRGGLACLAASIPEHQTAQTAYIPPRIWSYQISRLRECLEDFLEHRKDFEACYRFSSAAHVYNYARFMKGDNSTKYRPFQPPSGGKHGRVTGCRYYGPFINTARRFGIANLISRWLDVKEEDFRPNTLSSYLVFISHVGLAYILNFSLMRVEEAWGLRSDCLQIESDPQFGDIHVLSGETTKTMSDQRALWVTSPSVTVAIQAMRAVAELRQEIALITLPDLVAIKPSSLYLIDYQFAPWLTKKHAGSKSLRPSIYSYKRLLQSGIKLFDPEQLRITPKDFELARMVTPTLTDEFAVGEIWPLAWHQLRRTGAVNMQASGWVSDASLQFQLKHVARAMSLYYGQNHSKIRLEEKAHTSYVRTMYEVLGKQLQQLATDRFISPHGEKRKAEIVRLVLAAEEKKLISLAERGLVAHRPVVLGVCTSRIPCPYGGIDNIAHCGGGDSGADPKPCAHVLYDSRLLDQVENLEAVLDELIETADANSPLMGSLEAQKRSVENYRNVIRESTS